MAVSLKSIDDAVTKRLALKTLDGFLQQRDAVNEVKGDGEDLSDVEF